jgi:hypothetical protein
MLPLPQSMIAFGGVLRLLYESKKPNKTRHGNRH